MTEIDDRIRAALDADDKEFLASLEGDRGLFRQLGDSMGGALGGWARLVFAMTFLLSAVTAWCVWQMFQTADPRETIMWATATVVLFLSIGFLKDWLFSRMNMLSILREVKRLELQVALLAEQHPKA